MLLLLEYSIQIQFLLLVSIMVATIEEVKAVIEEEVEEDAVEVVIKENWLLPYRLTDIEKGSEQQPYIATFRIKNTNFSCTLTKRGSGKNL